MIVIPGVIDFESASWIDFDSIVPPFRIRPNAGDTTGACIIN